MRQILFIAALISLFFFAFSEQASFAQPSDFFSATSNANSRFKNNPDPLASPTNCANCPGFNPCNGITAIGGTSCDGNGLLRPTLVDGTGTVTQVGTVGPRPCISLCGGNPLSEVKATPLFAATGPGALTDNMFGVVSDPTQTDAGVGLGTTPFGKGTRAPSKCGNTDLATGAFDPTLDPGVRSGLNCGYLRYDLATQGVTTPAGANTLPLGQTMSRLTTMAFTSTDGTPCVLAYNVDGSGNSTTPIVPRAANTGTGCDKVDFNGSAHAFTSNIFPTGTDWSAATGTFTGVSNGLYSNFIFSRNVVCRSDGGATDTICARQSLVQDTQTENGLSHSEWAFIWSSQDVGGGTPSSSVTDCGGQANPTGKVCVHWFSDYEDSPCKITTGSYDPNAGPNNCRGVATGYGFLDVTEGYFLYNGDATAASAVSYPMGPQASFGNISGATTP